MGRTRTSKTKTQRKRKRRNKQKGGRRNNQKGGVMPYVVDPVKAVNVTEQLIDAFKKPKKSVSVMKQTVKSYKQQYADYKRKGGKDSYEKWGIHKGIMKKAPTNCSIM